MRANLTLFLVVATGCSPEEKVTSATTEVKLTNVSYDPTRELYTEVNAAFAKFWEGKTELNTCGDAHCDAPEGAATCPGDCT